MGLKFLKMSQPAHADNSLLNAVLASALSGGKKVPDPAMNAFFLASLIAMKAVKESAHHGNARCIAAVIEMQPYLDSIKPK